MGVAMMPGTDFYVGLFNPGLPSLVSVPVSWTVKASRVLLVFVPTVPRIPPAPGQSHTDCLVNERN